VFRQKYLQFGNRPLVAPERAEQAAENQLVSAALQNVGNGFHRALKKGTGGLTASAAD
jgi:hypothetical protein